MSLWQSIRRQYYAWKTLALIPGDTWTSVASIVAAGIPESRVGEALAVLSKKAQIAMRPSRPIKSEFARMFYAGISSPYYSGDLADAFEYQRLKPSNKTTIILRRNRQTAQS